MFWGGCLFFFFLQGGNIALKKTGEKTRIPHALHSCCLPNHTK